MHSMDPAAAASDVKALAVTGTGTAGTQQKTERVRSRAAELALRMDERSQLEAQKRKRGADCGR
jgi:hypothetical protein